MYDWLIESKRNGSGNAHELFQILDLEEYKVEFERYNLDNLPVCNITFNDAFDFFMNFDNGNLTNKRLLYKLPYFEKFYNNLEDSFKTIDLFSSLNGNDINFITNFLNNGLLDNLIDNSETYIVLLIISIGNSMGWPYKNYIDFDVANLSLIENKKSFLHIISVNIKRKCH